MRMLYMPTAGINLANYELFISFRPADDSMWSYGLMFLIPLAGMLWTAPTGAADLAAYQWEKRLLLIFAPRPSDQRLAALEKSLNDKSADVQDRALLVFRIFENGPSYVDRRKLPHEDAESLRRRFKAPSGEIRQILIGKDGSVKLTGDEKTTLQSVFDLIDTMPMRRQEMREREVRNAP